MSSTTSPAPSSTTQSPPPISHRELADPPKGHALNRKTRIVPPEKHGLLYKENYTHYCQLNNTDYAITAHVQVKQSKPYKCCETIYGDIAIIETDKEEQVLGDVFGRTISTVQVARGAKDEPLWKQEILTCPEDYKGDVTLHGDSSDALSDTQKVFQHLFESDGQLKEHLDPDVKDMLRDQATLHYIDSFCIRPEYRGKDLGEHAMIAYLGAVTKVPGECPVILSPAPLQTETIRMREANKVTGRNADIVQKLVQFYGKIDYKMAHQGSKRAAGTKDQDTEMTDVDDAMTIAESDQSEQDDQSMDTVSDASTISPTKPDYDEEEILVSCPAEYDNDDEERDGDFTPDQDESDEDDDEDDDDRLSTSRSRVSRNELKNLEEFLPDSFWSEIN
ncbi:hypothetical protein PRZ48_008977 [Zasmidium cellare]|uniref:N-acetyltransferase domain-containing protein n=1 Tax=Zasmidium cellare TaxID=395010 RepID=A0ABR0EHS8_ZASCE|nr:hypothetical protein PRZ48_008977 [Zasmidium cellare]